MWTTQGGVKGGKQKGTGAGDRTRKAKGGMKGRGDKKGKGDKRQKTNRAEAHDGSKERTIIAKHWAFALPFSAHYFDVDDRRGVCVIGRMERSQDGGMSYGGGKCGQVSDLS
jgi:hypothetical protein